MIPHIVVVVDRLPLLPNGKVDRMVLATMSAAKTEVSAGSGVSGDPFEALVAQIWSEVLEVAAVDLHVSFMDSGGDSLKAMRLASRLLERCGIEFALPALFAATVRELADVMRAAGAEFSSRPVEA